MGFLKRLFGRKQVERAQVVPERPEPERPAVPVAPDFALGENIISDADIRTFADLGRYYPLPQGFEYQEMEGGVPVIVRLGDGKQFKFLIEADLLTFDDPYVKADGKTAYRTTEVFKRQQ